jgi:hypothetical protein
MRRLEARIQTGEFMPRASQILCIGFVVLIFLGGFVFVLAGEVFGIHIWISARYSRWGERD